MTKPLLQNLTASHRRVVEILFQQGSASRAEIASVTGFTKPTISQIVQDLTEWEVVGEDAARKGLRGQPARPVSVRRQAGFAIGVNFSTSFAEVVAVDLAGSVIDAVQAPLGEPSPECLAALIHEEMERLIRRKRLAKNRLLGAGISFPGDFYADGTLMPHALFPKLKATHLDRFFCEALGIPVIVENDGRVCALGERVIGVGTRFRTFMLVHIGHGVGGGLIIDGAPYRGVHGNAGILGQYYPYGEPRPSALDLLRTLQKAGFCVPDFDTLADLTPDALPTIEAWMDRAAQQLVPELARISRFFGPEAIVLAGRLPPFITRGLVERLDLAAVLQPLDDLPVTPVYASNLGSRAGAVGAATLPIYQALLPLG